MDEAEAYEAAIMATAPGEPAPDVEPPEDYRMSPGFQEWLVRRMREELFGQDGGMALLDARALQGLAGVPDPGQKAAGAPASGVLPASEEEDREPDDHQA